MQSLFWLLKPQNTQHAAETTPRQAQGACIANRRSEAAAPLSCETLHVAPSSRLPTAQKDLLSLLQFTFPHEQKPTHYIRIVAMPSQRMHARSPTFPLYHSTRKKPRRWPLVLRFIKGAIHVDIAVPVILSALWSAFIVYLDHVRDDHIGLPGSIIPSLSIVVGLMLVFRNQTSYDRFWQVC